MGRKYDSFGDLRMRLNGTIAFYDGKPCFLSTQNMEFPMIKVFFIPSKETLDINHEDSKLNTNSPNLGYINYNNSAHYLVRMPTRAQNQALRTDQIEPYMGNIVHTKAFYDCLMGKYPTKNTAIKAVKLGDCYAMAFSRKFAVSEIRPGILSLDYMGNEVGYLHEDEFKLYPSRFTSFIHNLLEKGNFYGKNERLA